MGKGVITIFLISRRFDATKRERKKNVTHFQKKKMNTWLKIIGMYCDLSAIFSHMTHFINIDFFF